MKPSDLTIEMKEIFALRSAAQMLLKVASESTEIDLAKAIKDLTKEADKRESKLKVKK
jgi:hypothetical protein